MTSTKSIENQNNTNDEKIDLIKLVIYDFDQTITQVHLYYELSGGQLDELELVSEQRLKEIFGGEARLKRLKTHFDRVSSAATIAILSFGYTSVIKKALQRVNLPHFDQCTIIGNDSTELQTAGSKAKCVSNLKKQHKLKSKQVLFVDDDKSNLVRANQYCHTLPIEPREGMTNEHMADIERRCGVNEGKESERSSISITSPRTVQQQTTKKYPQQNDSEHKDKDKDKDNNSNSNSNDNGNDNSNSNSNSTNQNTAETNNKKEWKNKYSIDVPEWFDSLHKEKPETQHVIMLDHQTPSESEGPYELIVPNDIKSNNEDPANEDQDSAAISGISLNIDDN